MTSLATPRPADLSQVQALRQWLMATIPGRDDDDDEPAEEFLVRLPPGPLASLSVQQGATGGYTVPRDTAGVIEVGLASSVVRRLADVVRTPTGAPYD